MDKPIDLNKFKQEKEAKIVENKDGQYEIDFEGMKITKTSVLNGALQDVDSFDEVLIVTWDEKDNFTYRSTTNKKKDVLWAIEQLKHDVIFD